MHRLLAISLLFFTLLVNAKEAEKNNLVKVLIRPECKWMFFPPDFDDKHHKWPDYVLWDSSRAKPLSFKDPRTQITFYVETDGRHLSAIDAEGKLLWVHNPFEEDKAQCEYRTPHPVIVRIEIFENPESLKFDEGGPKLDFNHKFIRIYFDSSQDGIVDEETGKYIWLGQN
ncbi:MAG: hypothetical protein EOO07_25945 [Chitinophagaceae bacterium]|nr:MAG: hypothetical protein EOO07_25945 [Chitinophagaceae bacterium]